jgi:hypothetical protein
MIRLPLALALALAAAPAFAMGPDTMSCADFVAMDEAGQMAAMTPAEGGMMAPAEGGMMASDGDAGGMMASGGDAGGMMAEDHGAMAAASACAAHPDMTVGDAMKATN